MYLGWAWITMLPVIALGLFSGGASIYLMFFAKIEK